MKEKKVSCSEKSLCLPQCLGSPGNKENNSKRMQLGDFFIPVTEIYVLEVAELGSCYTLAERQDFPG